MNVLAIVPARGGSKGVPKKNIKHLNGKPLITYPLSDAFESKYVNKVVVSTDSKEIGELAESNGAEVVYRPKELATDTSLVIDAIIYTVNYVEEQGFKPDLVLLLEPTSPFRFNKLIDQSIELLMHNKYDSVTTITPSGISPNRLWKVNEKSGELAPYLEGADPFLPRQKQPRAFELTGQIYVFKPEFLKMERSNNSLLFGKVGSLIVDEATAIDIDTEVDFVVAEAILKYFKSK